MLNKIKSVTDFDISIYRGLTKSDRIARLKLGNLKAVVIENDRGTVFISVPDNAEFAWDRFIPIKCADALLVNLEDKVTPTEVIKVLDEMEFETTETSKSSFRYLIPLERDAFKDLYSI